MAKSTGKMAREQEEFKAKREEIFRLVGEDRLEELMRLLGKDAPNRVGRVFASKLNLVDDYGRLNVDALMCVAAEKGAARCSKWFLESSECLRGLGKGAPGWSPLMAAVRVGNLDMMALFGHHSALWQKDDRGRRAIDVCFEMKDEEKRAPVLNALVDLLLKDDGSEYVEWSSVLSSAVMLSQIDSVGVLLSKLKDANWNPKSVVDCIILNGRLGRIDNRPSKERERDREMLSMLMGKVPSSKDGCEWKEAGLGYAAQSGRADLCALLMEAGAKLDAVDVDGKTALMRGVRHVDVVKQLGPSTLDQVDRKGWNAMMHAAAAGSVESMKAISAWEASQSWRVGMENLGETTARARKPSKDGRTVLMLACGSGQDEAAKWALQMHGSEALTSKDANGEGVLFYAASSGKPWLIAELVKSGADVLQKNNHGKMVHECLAEFAKPDAMEERVWDGIKHAKEYYDSIKMLREMVAQRQKKIEVDRVHGLPELNALANKLAEKRQGLSELSILAKTRALRLCRDRRRLVNGGA